MGKSKAKASSTQKTCAVCPKTSSAIFADTQGNLQLDTRTLDRQLVKSPVYNSYARCRESGKVR